MKKYIAALSIALAAHGAYAQFPVYHSQNTRAANYYVDDNNTTTAYGNIWSPFTISGANAYTIWTVGGGSGAITRGKGPGSIDDLTIVVTNNITGRITYWETANNSQYPNLQTTVISSDGTRIVGSSVDVSNANRGNKPVEAFFVSNNKANVDAGNFRLVEGVYIGGTGGYDGGFFDQAQSLTIDGASFIGGYGDKGGNGLGVVNMAGALVISNQTGKLQATLLGTTLINDKNESLQGGTGNIVDAQISLVNRTNTVNGSEGLYVSAVTGGTTIHGGDFLGGDASLNLVSISGYNSNHNLVDAQGGIGAMFNAAGGAVTIHNGNFIGGAAGTAYVSGPYSSAFAFGGFGLYNPGSTLTINGGHFAGADGGSATAAPGTYIDPVTTNDVRSGANNQAYAFGGSGMLLTGGATINNATASGGKGGIAKADAYADASGGHGVRATNLTSFTINNGKFYGGKGGKATSTDTGTSIADGGSGLYASGSTVTINGGEFGGGEAGYVLGGTSSSALHGTGIWAVDSTINVNQTTNAPTTIHDGIHFSSSSSTSRTLNLQGGHVDGDIFMDGAGIKELRISTNTTYTGSFRQLNGTVNVTLASTNDAKSLTKVDVDKGTLNFNGFAVTTAKGSIFNLNSSSVINNYLKLTLSKDTQFNVKMAQVKTSAGDLTLEDGASLNFQYDGLLGTNGTAAVAGGKLVANTGSVIRVQGIAAKTAGSVLLVKSAITNGFDFLGQATTNIVKADLGWLTSTESINTNAGVLSVNFGYNSITNSTSLKDLPAGLLASMDGGITNANPAKFQALNSLGEDGGNKLLRFSASQVVDAASTAFAEQREVAGQLATRSTEFRAMNGLASAQPLLRPEGAAGPKSDADRKWQAWMRAYGGMGNREQDGKFVGYDTTVYGTVIGLDKSFGQSLVGLAGGFAYDDLQAASTYESTIKTYHGSVYTTLGDEEAYLDLSLTCGFSQTDVRNAASSDDFDSMTYGGYAGIGRTFSGSHLAFTPEASMLVSYYTQDSYARTGDIVSGTMQSYDEWSYLGALGGTLSTSYQIDWLNAGLALVPRARVRWLHEFNPDLDGFNYTVDGSTYTFGVRPLDEDTLNVGLGFDVWNWKYLNTRFEVDYDGLFGDTYTQHLVSGKFTHRF